jgi:hypothetical protein
VRVLHWLFGCEITRDEAIRIATRFALAEWETHTADWSENVEFPYDFVAAVLGGNYWYVRFTRRLPEGIVSSNTLMEIWVHKKTGEVDHGDNICRRYFESLDRGE